MANKVYENFYLSNEIEDQFNSHLDLMQFCTVDNSLVGTAGMKRKVNVYKATDGTEKLAMGAGNTKSIEVTFSEQEYTILLAQNRFKYYDEQAMTDPMLVPVGTRHMGTDMFNTVNKDIYEELKNDIEGDNDPESISGSLFALVNPADIATLRKNLKDDLKYVETFARTGYVGTVAGVNVYTKKDATAGEPIIASREAVTLFNKLGVEVEQERDPDTRENSIFSRKYYFAALTDATKAVKIKITPAVEESMEYAVAEQSAARKTKAATK